MIEQLLSLPFWAKSLIVFGLTTMISVMWALYFRYSSEHRPIAAANADVALVAIGMANVLSYTHDMRLAIPVLVGTWAGTVLAIKRHKSPPNTESEELQRLQERVSYLELVVGTNVLFPEGHTLSSSNPLPNTGIPYHLLVHDDVPWFQDEQLAREREIREKIPRGLPEDAGEKTGAELQEQEYYTIKNVCTCDRCGKHSVIAGPDGVRPKGWAIDRRNITLIPAPSLLLCEECSRGR
jgi:hypothetical protein